MNKESQRRKEEKACARIETFSDGVFSIAITLLVLDVITVLHFQKGDKLLNVFQQHWQVFFAFFVGFITILVCWINHHHIFSHIKKCDARFMWANGFLLMMVSITPFSTAALAEYISTESNIALALFGLTYFLMSLVYERVSTHAYKQNLIHDDDDRNYFNCVKLTYRYCMVYTFIVFFICFINITVAIILYSVMFTVFAFPHQFVLRLMKRKQKAL